MIGDTFEALLVHAVSGAVRRLGWRRSLAIGERLGDTARSLGVRRAVALANLAAVRPAWTDAEVRAIVIEHYRELGRIAVEYPRLPDLVRAPAGEVVAEIEGFEHLEAARAAGRGAIIMTGHFGNFELLGAVLGKTQPVDFVVRRMQNASVERWIEGLRSKSGVGILHTHDNPRRIYESLKANRWVAMLGDQDARGRGAFVPFLGRPASTSLGPARIAVGAGAPIIMGFVLRRPDGRHHLVVEPPLVPGPGGDDAVLDLTARHVARLEHWVRRHPAQWLWLHRRWKSQPPAAAALTAV